MRGSPCGHPTGTRSLLAPAASLVCLLLACKADPVGPAGSATAGSGGATSSATGAATSGTGGATSASTGGAGGGGGTGGGIGGGSSSAAGGGSGGSAGTTEVTIENPGFEADLVSNGDFDDQVVPAGWDPYDPGDILGLDYNTLGVLNPTGTVLYPGGAPEGSNVAIVFLWRAQTDGSPAGLVQTLSDVLTPSTHYTLRVRVGNIAPVGGVSYDLAGFPGYRVELLAGAEVIAMDDDTLSPGEGEFLESVVSVTTGLADPQLGEPLSVRLVNLNAGDSGIEVNFDDVRLDAAVGG